jgi:hypothetical protein
LLVSIDPPKHQKGWVKPEEVAFVMNAIECRLYSESSPTPFLMAMNGHRQRDHQRRDQHLATGNAITGAASP